MERTLQQKNSNCIKVVLFGPESTGKSTLAKELADQMIFMDEGMIVEKADTKEFFANPKSDRTKLFLSQIL